MEKINSGNSKSEKTCLEELNQVLTDYARNKQECEKLDAYASSVANVYANSGALYDEASDVYKKKTSIQNRKDLWVFGASLAINLAIKYLIKRLREMDSSKLASKLHKPEHSKRGESLYYATREEILANPVPFDAIQKLPDFKLGLNGFNHRYKTLGHTMFFGAIVGTANIMTSTITLNNLMSYHVKTRPHQRTRHKDSSIYNVYLDTVVAPASTWEIFISIVKRLKEERKEGWLALGTAFCKEMIHLLSDLPTKTSCPFGIVSSLSPDLAREMAFYGINAGTILEGYVLESIGNYLVATLHRLLCNKDEMQDMALYKVRTKKIIALSNLIATDMDYAYTLALILMNDKNALRKFDLGGMLLAFKKYKDFQIYDFRQKVEYQMACKENIINNLKKQYYGNL